MNAQARVSPLDTIEVLPPGNVVRLSDVLAVTKLTRRQLYRLLDCLNVKLIRVAGIREIRMRLDDARLVERHLAGELELPQAPRAPVMRRSRAR